MAAALGCTTTYASSEPDNGTIGSGQCTHSGATIALDIYSDAATATRVIAATRTAAEGFGVTIIASANWEAGVRGATPAILADVRSRLGVK